MKTVRKMNSPTAEAIYALATPEVEKLGFELVAVEYVRENGRLFCRLLIDKRGGIDIDECALVNEKLDPFIEQHFPELDYDYFEVSSPGLDRPLITPADFIRHLGEAVEVKLYGSLAGKKTLLGELIDCDEQGITLRSTEEVRQINFADIAKVTLQIIFD